MEKTYILTITGTENGLKVEETGDGFSEFELIGILNHVCQSHSLKLSNEIKNYEQ